MALELNPDAGNLPRAAAARAQSAKSSAARRPVPAEKPQAKTAGGNSAVAKLPEFVELQLATLVDEVPSGDEWLHEVKFDGYRALCRIADGKVKFLTRHGLDWSAKFASLGQPNTARAGLA